MLDVLRVSTMLKKATNSEIGNVNRPGLSERSRYLVSVSQIEFP